MCFICDGGTEEEWAARTRDRIREFGFTMVAVGSGTRSWTYTIGLLETFGHPELVVTTLAAQSAFGLINGMVDRIRSGERFDASSRETSLQGQPVRFGLVHRTQWVQGRFAAWVNHYGESGFLPAEPNAVQLLWANDDGVFPPDRDFCHHHRHCQPLLAFAVAANVHESARRKRRPRRR